VCGNFALDSWRNKFQPVTVFEPNNCAAVIPCFNESARIATLVAAVRRHLPCVLVVDDGSTDDTGTLAQAAGGMVLRHERNLGKGAALKTGSNADTSGR
jgi:glycosyltransferase involved in cell wall biosynthesis